MRLVLFFLVILLNLPTLSHAKDPHISSISPENQLVGGDITIRGTNFGTKNGKAYLHFTYKNHTTIISIKRNSNSILIGPWTSNKIVARIPVFPNLKKRRGKIKIQVENSGGSKSNSIEYSMDAFDVVQQAIQMKKGNLNDSQIIEHLYNKGIKIREKNPDFNDVFGDTSLTGEQMIKLKEAKFNDSFIDKMAGIPQRVTIGAAGIYLMKTADLVATPMVRIFLAPRSYFTPRTPFWPSKWEDVLNSGILDPSKYDLNIGYTASTSTDANNENENYVLAGFSFEINRSALFNFGFAFVPKDIEGKKRQVYLGVTIDSNILKELKVIPK